MWHRLKRFGRRVFWMIMLGSWFLIVIGVPLMIQFGLLHRPSLIYELVAVPLFFVSLNNYYKEGDRM